MKWLIILFSLFVHTQVSAAGLCKPSEHQGKFDCIAGWNGATNYVAYAGALAALLDKFSAVIAYDSLVTPDYWFGRRCEIYPGVPDEDAPAGCQDATGEIDVPLINAFHQTLEASDELMSELEKIDKQLSYGHPQFDQGGAEATAKDYDKRYACSAANSVSRVSPLWVSFANSFQQDYNAHDNQYRKKILKHHFQAIKRLYGFYASRMNRLSRDVKREHNCS